MACVRDPQSQQNKADFTDGSCIKDKLDKIQWGPQERL